jgi:hypothetical protein
MAAVLSLLRVHVAGHDVSAAVPLLERRVQRQLQFSNRGSGADAAADAEADEGEQALLAATFRASVRSQWRSELDEAKRMQRRDVVATRRARDPFLAGCDSLPWSTPS